MKSIALSLMALLAALVFAGCQSQSKPLKPVACMIDDSFKIAGVVDELPILVRTADPEYPVDLAKEYVTGEACLRFSVGVDSRASEVEVIKQTKPEFGESAKKAAKELRFKPARKGGKDVAVYASMIFLFVFRSDLEDSSNIAGDGRTRR